MKYSCDLVQDLYPLYEEGDLSPSVKEKVEEHLSECENCRTVYTSGEGFASSGLSDMEPAVPQSLDERIRLTMKLRRMKFFLVIISSILLLILANHYQNQRQGVVSAYHQVHRGAEDLVYLVQSAPEASVEELNFLKEVAFAGLNEGVEELTQSLNWLEEQKRKDFNMYLEQQSLYTTLDNLNLRKSDGRWDNTDQQVFALLIQLAEEYWQVVEEDYDKFNHGYSSYFETVDIEGLSKPLEEINKLTYTYNRFHQLPDEVKQLNETELKQRIGSIFNLDSTNIHLEKNDNYSYRFTSKNKNVSGEVDAFSGYPLRIDDSGSVKLKGKLLDVDDAKEKATSMINRIYGKDKNFNVEYLGVNVNISSNNDAKFYSFGFMPMFDSLPVYAFSDGSFTMHFDARSGEFKMMRSVKEIPLKPDTKVDITEKISPEQGLNTLTEKVQIEDGKLAEKRQYEYIDTFVIYSSTSGGMVPVHAYGLSDKDHTWRYINTVSGKEELLYNEH
ncbi:zf-HC2 domain-containing protein [Bacillus sp. SG-1]|uniref:zf-HC2 domain-containing protein n=1 Tax=Bacillus sp. SG-1 TaxID=161544 RepID=UPI0005C4E213|nr:zf-HC2 domain-containing protein [Bacillus sp. SG-1]